MGDRGGRRVGEQGGRGWGRRLDRVGGAGMREGVAVHRGRDEGLRTARLGVVAVPLVAGAVVLDLRDTRTKINKSLKKPNNQIRAQILLLYTFKNLYFSYSCDNNVKTACTFS